MSWIYEGQEFNDNMIPDDAVGFIYMIEGIINGKVVKYIGKKNFFTDAKCKIPKKALPKDKRKKTYTRVRKMTYAEYYSSNATIKEAHKNGVPFKRTMLKICKTKGQLTYEEVKLQFYYNVLESDEWLNGNILGRFYKQKT